MASCSLCSRRVRPSSSCGCGSPMHRCAPAAAPRRATHCCACLWGSRRRAHARTHARTPRLYAVQDANQNLDTDLDTGMKDLTLISWSAVGPQLAIGNAKGDLVIYNKQQLKKQLIRGKHTKKITCGAWNSENKLALGSEDRQATHAPHTRPSPARGRLRPRPPPAPGRPAGVPVPVAAHRLSGVPGSLPAGCAAGCASPCARPALPCGRSLSATPTAIRCTRTRSSRSREMCSSPRGGAARPPQATPRTRPCPWCSAGSRCCSTM